MELDGRPYWFELVPNDARPLTDAFGAGDMIVPAGSVLDIRCAAFASPDVLRDLGNVVSATIVIRQDHARGLLLHTSTVAAAEFDDTLTLEEWRTRAGEHFRFLISGEETNWAIRGKWRGTLWIEIGLDTDEGKASVRTGKGLCQASGLDTAGESGVTADEYYNRLQADARYEALSRKDASSGYAGLDADGKLSKASSVDANAIDGADEEAIREKINAAQKTIYLFLAAGQSNEQGVGDSAESPVPLAGTAYKFEGSTILPMEDPVENSYGEPYPYGGAVTGCSHPSFCAEYYRLTGRIVGVVQTAVGGTSLIAANQIDSSINNWSTTGTRFALAITAYETAKAALVAEGWRVIDAGVLWCQGEQDATKFDQGTGTVQAYQDALIALGDRFRVAIGDDNLPFFITLLGERTTINPFAFMLFRNAQLAAVAADERNFVGFSRAGDFPGLGLMNDDNIHWDQTGQNLHGRSRARVAVTGTETMESQLMPLTGVVDPEGVYQGVPGQIYTNTVTGREFRKEIYSDQYGWVSNVDSYIPQRGLKWRFEAGFGLYKSSAPYVTPGSGEGVRTWAGRVVNNPAFVQTTSANQPTYQPTGIGGAPALQFDGSNDNLSAALQTLTTGSAEGTLVLIGRQAASPAGRPFGRTNGATDLLQVVLSGSQTNVGVGTDTGGFGLDSVPVPGSTSYILIARMRSGRSELWINGRLCDVDTTAFATLTHAGGPMTIGASSGSNHYNGLIAEVAMHTAFLSDEEMADWHAWAQRKYNVVLHGGGSVVPMFANTANGGPAATDAETSLLGTGVGSATIPANTLLPGTTIRFRATGYLTTTGTPNVAILAKLGSTTIISTGAVALAEITGNGRFTIEGALTCRTTGASGTVIGQMDIFYLAPTFTVIPITVTAAVTVDTTAALAFDLTANFDSSQTMAATNVVVERIQ